MTAAISGSTGFVIVECPVTPTEMRSKMETTSLGSANPVPPLMSPDTRPGLILKAQGLKVTKLMIVIFIKEMRATVTAKLFLINTT